MTLPQHVIAVDPGLKTGIAHLSSEGPRLLSSFEVDVLSVESTLKLIVDEIRNGLLASPRMCTCAANSDDPVHAPSCPLSAPELREILPIVEQFTITARTAKNSQAPWSLEVTGIARNFFWRDLELELDMQKPDVMKLFPNPTLHALDCWHKGGDGHANDAIRHALVGLHRRGWRDRRMLPA
jgi:hypothetical protein